MLTREAFNALLKTLEEPPQHVKFVLCTTEPEKLPITILSRCQRFDFTTVDTVSIAGRLAQIVEAEGADVSPEALTLIARRAAGSMRDSQSLLEQLLGSASGPIGVDEVHALIGTGREERIGELVAAIAAREPARGLAALDASLQGGADPGGVLDQLIAALRECLLASVGCDPSMLTRSQGLGVDLAALGGSMGTATLLAMLQILDQSLSRMRTSGHAALLAEMAVIRLATLEDLESVSAAVDRLASASGAVAAVPASAAGNAAPRLPVPAVAAPAPQKKTTDLTDRGVEPAPSAVAPPLPAAITPTPELPADASAAWKAASATLEGLAGDCAAEAIGAAWRDDQLEVTLPAHATTAGAFLRRPEISAAISRALESLAGRRLRHAIVMIEASVEPVVATPAEQPRPVSVQTQASLLREAGEHPLVAHARTLFDAAIRKVEPPRPREPRATASAASVASAAESGQVAGDGDHGDATNDEAGHMEEQHG